MKPYYDYAGITIYHGDCREVLKDQDCQERFEDLMCIVTDPPYGYAYESSYAEWSGVYAGGSYARTDGSLHGDGDTSLRDSVLASLTMPWVVFGNLKSIVPGARGVLVWDKGDASGMGDLAFPWKPNWELIFIGGDGFAGPRTSGVLRANNISRLSMGRLHPTEKPTDLLRQILPKCPGLILDPFMGSGTTLRAAKDLGRRAIGIEIEERYCEIAAKRLSQEVLDLGV